MSSSASQLGKKKKLCLSVTRGSGCCWDWMSCLVNERTREQADFFCFRLYCHRRRRRLSLPNWSGWWLKCSLSTCFHAFQAHCPAAVVGVEPVAASDMQETCNRGSDSPPAMMLRTTSELWLFVDRTTTIGSHQQHRNRCRF